MPSAPGSNWAALRKSLTAGKQGVGSGPSRSSAKNKKEKKNGSGGKNSGKLDEKAKQAAKNATRAMTKREAKGKKKRGSRDAVIAVAKKRKGGCGGDEVMASVGEVSKTSNDAAMGATRVGGKPPTPVPPPPFPHPTKLGVLMPESPGFEDCLRHSYGGFVHDQPSAFPAELHEAVEGALEEMTSARLFHYDIVSAGKAVSSTFCERTLLGDEGMTYHYQRLRIFAYPWEDKNTEEGSPFRVLRRLNEAMTKRTNELLDKQENLAYRGSAEYNVTLINKMAAPQDCAVPLKDEALYGMGPTSVSWHADSSLQDWSSIAVYQTTANTPQAADWHVAVRIAHDEATPALRLPLRTRETYYMLADFNAHHHHAVLAGSSERYSSTHRVAVTDRDTWRYIEARCKAALGVIRDAGERAVTRADGLRTVGEAHVEVELQWLRMFWIQGQRHAASHASYWLPRMEKLKRWWARMEGSLKASLRALEAASTGAEEGATGGVEGRSYGMAMYVLEELARGRAELRRRCKSPPYRALPRDCQPIVDRPCALGSEPLWEAFRSVKRWRQGFEASAA